MNPTDEPRRPVARLVPGFRDTYSDEVQARRGMFETIRQVYERYGFVPLETPAIEFVDVLGKFLPESNTPAAGIFSWKEDTGKDEEGKDREEWVSLRYDLTAPLSRVVAMGHHFPLPYRRYQVGPVYRREASLEPGRFQEFYQMDFDSIGVPGVAADAEACCIMSETLEALGIHRGQYIVRANNRKVLGALIEKIGIGAKGQETAWSEKALTVLRAIDKLDRIGLDGVVDLLGIGRKDPSGSFTPGAGLYETQVEQVRSFLEVSSTSRLDYCRSLEKMLSGSKSGEEGVREMVEIDEFLRKAGFDEDRVTFDTTVVRGLAYYTGPIFEATLTMEITDSDGVRRRFGSVFGGGRYDYLVERFTGQRIPATGASVGVDRLLSALKLLGRVTVGSSTAPVIVIALNSKNLPEYHTLAASLRSAGINTEVYMGGDGLAGQMRYADDTGKVVAVLRGDREKAAGTVSIKDLRRGKELSAEHSNRKSWLEALPGQVTVPEAKLVETVKDILARYDPARTSQP